VNDFLNTSPFDLYELSLFHLVVKHRSFTKAAQAAGLTQSAITRQIQGIENSLGICLLERTTRSVGLTKAGEFLFHESARLLGDVDQSLRRIKEDFTDARKEIRVGVSRSTGLRICPAFFTPISGRFLKLVIMFPISRAQTFCPPWKQMISTWGFCVRRRDCHKLSAQRIVSPTLLR